MPLEDPKDPVVETVDPIADPPAPDPAPEPDDIDALIGAADVDDDDLLKELGIDEPAKKPNRIPYDKVRKIVENARTKARKAYEDELAPRLTRASQLERLGALMESDPDAFIDIAAQHLNPKYAEVKALLAKAREKAEPAAAVDDPMPEPNYPIGNGQKTYDVKGLQSLQAWHARQTQRTILAEVEKRLSPVVKQSAEERQRQALAAQLAEARTWPEFTTYENEMAASLAADRTQTLDSVYRRIVVPKLAEAARKKALEELNGKPKSTSVGGATRPAPRKPAESLEDRMARIYDALEARERTPV